MHSAVNPRIAAAAFELKIGSSLNADSGRGGSKCVYRVGRRIRRGNVPVGVSELAVSPCLVAVVQGAAACGRLVLIVERAGVNPIRRLDVSEDITLLSSD